MPTKDQLFASRFFKAENFKKPIIVEIQECVIEPLKNQEGITKEKLVLFFVGQKQQLVCNATNFDSIVEVTGEMDTDMWVGHRICLYPTTTPLGNKKVAAIRVKDPKAATKAAPQPKAPPPADDNDVGSIPSAELERMRKEADEHGNDDVEFG